MTVRILRAHLDREIDGRALGLAVLIASIQDGIYALIFLSYINHYLLEVLHTRGGMPGYTLALYGVCKLVANPLSGRLIDSTSPRLVYRLSVLVQVAGTVLLITDGALGVFFLATALIAIGAGAAWPLTYDLVARTQPEAQHTSVTGMLSVFGYVATGIGFVLGVMLSRFTPWRVAFIVSLVIVAFPIVFAGMRALSGHTIQHAPRERLALGQRLRAVTLFGAMVLTNFAAVTGIAAAYGAYTHDALNLNLLQTTFVLTPGGVAAVLGLWAASRWSKPARRMAELALMAGMAAAGTLALWATHQWLVAIFIAIPPAAALGGMGPVIAAAIIEHGGIHDRGLVIGTLMAIEGIGGVIGPAIVASAIEVVSPGAGFGAIGIMFVLMGVFAIAAQRSEATTRATAGSPDAELPLEHSATKG